MEAAYFDTEEKIESLRIAALGWLNTPFVAHAAQQCVGVDCVHLCAELYKQTGAIKTFDPPQYTLDAGKHLGKSIVIEWLEKSERFARVEDCQPGDIVCFNLGRVEHHCGIVTTRWTFVHSIQRYGVKMAMLSDPTYRKRLSATFRPLPWPES